MQPGRSSALEAMPFFICIDDEFVMRCNLSFAEVQVRVEFARQAFPTKRIEAVEVIEDEDIDDDDDEIVIVDESESDDDMMHHSEDSCDSDGDLTSTHIGDDATQTSSADDSA